MVQNDLIDLTKKDVILIRWRNDWKKKKIWCWSICPVTLFCWSRNQLVTLLNATVYSYLLLSPTRSYFHFRSKSYPFECIKGIPYFIPILVVQHIHVVCMFVYSISRICRRDTVCIISHLYQHYTFPTKFLIFRLGMLVHTLSVHALLMKLGLFTIDCE